MILVSVLISLLTVSDLYVGIVILDSLQQVLKWRGWELQMQGLKLTALRRLSDLSSCIARDGYRIFAHTVSCFFCVTSFIPHRRLAFCFYLFLQVRAVHCCQVAFVDWEIIRLDM
jgi:hypothetical protein